MEYKIIVSEVIEDVEDMANKLLKEGWEFKPESDIIYQEGMFILQMVRIEYANYYGSDNTAYA